VTEPAVAKPQPPRLMQGLHGGLSREQFRDYLRMGFALLLLVVSVQGFNEGCLSLRTLWGHESRVPFFRNEVLVVEHDVKK
jgi:hypothetical protein